MRMKYGGRIRALRKQKGMTLDQLSRLSGLSTPFLSQIERDLASPAVSSLANVAKALGVSMSYFVETGSGTATFRDADRLTFFELVPGQARFARLAGHFDGRQLEPMLVRIPPGTRWPRFGHAGEEFVYVLAGELTITLGEERRVLTAGASGHHPSTLDHDWVNEGDVETTLIWVGSLPLF